MSAFPRTQRKEVHAEVEVLIGPDDLMFGVGVGLQYVVNEGDSAGDDDGDR